MRDTARELNPNCVSDVMRRRKKLEKCKFLSGIMTLYLLEVAIRLFSELKDNKAITLWMYILWAGLFTSWFWMMCIVMFVNICKYLQIFILSLYSCCFLPLLSLFLYLSRSHLHVVLPIFFFLEIIPFPYFLQDHSLLIIVIHFLSLWFSCLSSSQIAIRVFLKTTVNTVPEEWHSERKAGKNEFESGSAMQKSLIACVVCYRCALSEHMTAVVLQRTAVHVACAGLCIAAHETDRDREKWEILSKKKASTSKTPIRGNGVMRGICVYFTISNISLHATNR